MCYIDTGERQQLMITFDRLFAFPSIVYHLASNHIPLQMPNKVFNLGKEVTKHTFSVNFSAPSPWCRLFGQRNDTPNTKRAPFCLFSFRCRKRLRRRHRSRSLLRARGFGFLFHQVSKYVLFGYFRLPTRSDRCKREPFCLTRTWRRMSKNGQWG